MYTPEEIKKSVREAGIVGAGGAGFPAYVKYNAHVDTVIVNAAECEPLLRVDQQLAARETEKLLKGLELACIATGASRGVVGIKGKCKKAISSIEQVLKAGNFSVPVTVHLLKNYYPAGDEHVLVYDVTGRIVPEGGIPLEVGVVVNNVNTLLNVADSMKGLPVTDRPLTITGEVEKPVTVRLPVGTSIREAIAVAGGATVKDFVVVSGGPMMGKLVEDIDSPVTKTTSGLIVLSSEHKLALHMSERHGTVRRLAAEVCCSCRVCTDMCPRHMLGHCLKPHKVMKSIFLGMPVKDHTQAFLCVECSVCEIACFMGLSPKKVFMELKQDMFGHGIKNPHRNRDLSPHNLREEHKLPVKRILSQLDLLRLEHDAPFSDLTYAPSKVIIPLKQHIGAPSLPVVKAGDKVTRGDLIAEIPEGSIGSRYHASISGVVTEITKNSIIIQER